MIEGLVKAVEHNGRWGTIIALDEVTGRSVGLIEPQSSISRVKCAGDGLIRWQTLLSLAFSRYQVQLSEEVVLKIKFENARI